MITGTLHIAFVPAQDTWGDRDDRVDERHIARELSSISGRISRVVINMGTARYPLISSDLIRQHLPANIDVEVVGNSADVVHRVLEQLDPSVRCDDCVDWLPCDKHMAAS